MQNKIIVKIVQDSDSESPRKDGNLGVMACWHKRYDLGDVQPKEDMADWLLKNAPKGSVVLTLYLYDHSGITMKTSAFADNWDSGHVGYIVATPEAIRKEYSVKRISSKIRKRVEDQLLGEVFTYNAYLTGDVWGFEIKQPNDCSTCGSADFDITDECYGFTGPDAMEQMKGHIPTELHSALAEAWDCRYN